mgnify:FL=1
MKDYKKAILGILKKRKDSGDKFESQLLKLTLKQIDGARDDGWGVFYSKNGKSLVSAKKTIEGSYAVKDDTEEIGDNAFWGCAFLRNVAVPNTVERIGDEAFARCISLESVCIPASVEKIGKNPFVDLDSKVINNESEAYVIDNKILYSADRTRLVSCLTDAAMVIVPKTVRVIGSLAFTRRAKLKKVQLPDGLERIGRDAFSDCDALEEVVIPASVKTIAPYAFGGCESLKKVTFLGEVQSLSRTAFSDCFNLYTILVPQGKEKAYRKILHITSESDTLVLGNEQVAPADSKPETPKAEPAKEMKEEKKEKKDKKDKKIKKDNADKKDNAGKEGGNGKK